MKKLLVIGSAVLVALVIFGAGFFFAQSNLVSAAGLPAGFGPGGMMGGRGGMGQMHEYVEQALADKLGMSKSDVESALLSGKSMHQIALDKGIKEADVTSLLSDVHKTAFAKAVKDGILTQTQADSMLQSLTANGFNFAEGRMHNGGGRGQRGGGMGGGMMNGWNQQPAATATKVP